MRTVLTAGAIAAVFAALGLTGLTQAQAPRTVEGPGLPVLLDAETIAPAPSGMVRAAHFGDSAPAPADAPSLKTAIWSEYIDGMEPVFLVLDPSGRMGLITPKGAWFLPDGQDLPLAHRS